MNKPSQLRNHETFTVEGCARVWCLGSGFAAALQPGTHRITGRIDKNGRSQVIIDDRYYLSEEEFATLPGIGRLISDDE